MKTEKIQDLFQKFEQICLDFEGIECWSGRELQKLLGYSKWDNFEKVVFKAQEACRQARAQVEGHFRPFTQLITMPNGGQRNVDDLMLTRYACYLIAQNGDSRKETIAFAQNYFAIQTRRAELVEKRLLDYERLKAREKLTETEKQLSEILYERGVDSQGFAMIRSKGDQALFHLSTAQLKRRFEVPEGRPLADFLPTISIKAKDLAAEMTGLKVQLKDKKGQASIEAEHIENNEAVREMLTQRGIFPELLPPAEDVKRLQKQLSSETEKMHALTPNESKQKEAS
ncbi:MAG: DNA damage-inducible protein D [Sphingobacteriaceae bacterium]|nr:DNA damage-inducible protein D [Sphingobacteriaceae bacterium]